MAYVFEVSLLLVEEVIASNSKCVPLLLLAFFVIDTHRHPASALTSRSVTRPRYGGTAVHTPAVATRSLFHITLLLFTDDVPISRP
jgi:hypothetical protein